MSFIKIGKKNQSGIVELRPDSLHVSIFVSLAVELATLFDRICPVDAVS